MTLPTLTRGLTPVRTVLENGAVAIAQQNVAAPTVAINATFAAGSVDDPLPLPGLAYLVSLALDRGTASRSADAIAEELDDRGVSLRIAVSRHGFSISCTCLTEDFPPMLALIADVARQPVFPPGEVEKRRAEAITAVRQDADSTATQASEALLQLLYGAEHPYGRPSRGTVESLERITRDDLLEFHRGRLLPSTLAIVVAGDVDPRGSITAVSRLFGDWVAVSAERAIVPPPAAAVSRRVRVVPMPGKSQSDIAYGFTAIRRLDPRYYAYWLLNNVLGQFGLGGRLADNIRERQGMAYYAFSILEATVGEGPLIIRAGVDPNDVRRAIDAMDLEVRRLGAEGPTADELEASREALVGSIPRLLETNEGIADFLQTAEHFGLGLDYDRHLPALLRGVTLQDVRQAARELLNAGVAAVAVAGPHDTDSAL